MFEASIDRLVSKFLKSKVRGGSSSIRRKLVWTLPILGLVAVLFFLSLRRPPKDDTVHQAVTQKLREVLDSHGVRVDCTACTDQDSHVNVRVRKRKREPDWCSKDFRSKDCAECAAGSGRRENRGVPGASGADIASTEQLVHSSSTEGCRHREDEHRSRCTGEASILFERANRGRATCSGNML